MTRLLFLAIALSGLALPASATELKVTTWNLEWLTPRHDGDPALPADVHPKTAADIAQLRRYADALKADVIALEEVDGPGIAAALFPPDKYNLFFTDDDVVQRVGLAVRRGISVKRNPDLTALDLYPNAHFHLRSGADITLDWPGGRLRVLAIHLKTGCQHDRLTSSRRPQCDTLRGQIPVLQGWIAQRREEGVPFVLLGDFNRWMDGRDQVLASLNAASPLVRATEGHDSPCWNGRHFIDHILAGGAARGWMEPDTLTVMTYREDISEKEYLSDHCPVSVRFQLPD